VVGGNRKGESKKRKMTAAEFSAYSLPLIAGWRGIRVGHWT
jgi:hypothetical protein